MTAEEFIGEFVSHLRGKAADLRSYGATDSAQACEQIATDLEANFRCWWLAGLSVSDAALESGYSEDGLRELVRNRALPATKGPGSKGHLLIARCDLPRRPKPFTTSVTSLENRLLKQKTPRLQKPA